MKTKTINLQLNESEKGLIEQYIINKIAAVNSIKLLGYKYTIKYYKTRLNNLRSGMYSLTDILEYIDIIDCKELEGVTNYLHHNITKKLKQTREYKDLSRYNEMYFKRQDKLRKKRGKHNRTAKYA